MQLFDSRNSDPSYKKIEDLFDAIYYFANDCISLLLQMNDELDINAYSNRYGHTPLIASIHWGNYRAAKIILQHPHIDVNKPESNLGWTPLHECVRCGRDDIAKLLISHSNINIWIKSYENQMALDIGQYLGHDRKCQSLIDIVNYMQSKSIQQSLPFMPKALCKLIASFTY